MHDVRIWVKWLHNNYLPPDMRYCQARCDASTRRRVDPVNGFWPRKRTSGGLASQYHAATKKGALGAGPGRRDEWAASGLGAGVKLELLVAQLDGIAAEIRLDVVGEAVVALGVADVLSDV